MQPPVFVMNPYYSGLGIARSLRGKGMAIYALSAERDAPGMRSRYFDGAYLVPDGRDAPSRLCERLLELARLHGARPVLFPTRDFDILFLHQHRDALNAAYALPQPQGSAVMRLMDKHELAAIASRCGIPAPATLVCRSAGELERRMQELPFPFVLKPRFAYQWRRKGLWQQVGMKAFILSSAAEARACYARLAPLEPEVLLQRYIPGEDCDIVVCCCYAGAGGSLLGHFTGRKLRQNPPLIGTGSIVEAADVAPIVQLSSELLQAFGYRGLAEIEFKYERTSGRHFLIEVNPRHWDQHELGNLVGVNLTWIAYQDLVGRAPEPCAPAYRRGRKYKWVAERELLASVAQTFLREFRHTRVTRGWLRGSLAAVQSAMAGLGAALGGEKVFGVFRLSDPVPGLLLSLRLLAEAWKVLAAARGSRP